jgi:hypothetical protein
MKSCCTNHTSLSLSSPSDIAEKENCVVTPAEIKEQLDVLIVQEFHLPPYLTLRCTTTVRAEPYVCTYCHNRINSSFRHTDNIACRLLFFLPHLCHFFSILYFLLLPLFSLLQSYYLFFPLFSSLSSFVSIPSTSFSFFFLLFLRFFFVFFRQNKRENKLPTLPEPQKKLRTSCSEKKFSTCLPHITDE